jgi:hypothetical protein
MPRSWRACASSVPAVQLVESRELQHGLQASRVDLIFEGKRDGRDKARIDRFLIALGNRDLRLIGIEDDGASAIADVGDEFQADPGAGKSRNRDGHQAIIDNFLNIAGK